MDYDKDNDAWEWKEEEYCLRGDSHIGMSNCLWEEVNQNEDLSYMFNETTPIKACGDLPYHVTDGGKSMNKESEEFREAPLQIKRRRMLRFNNHIADSSCSEMTSAFVKSKDRVDFIEEALPDTSQWVSEFSEDRNASGNNSIDHSSEGWFSNCLSDAEMHFSCDDMSISGIPDDQVDIEELCDIPPEIGANMVQVCGSETPRIVFKGKKSYIETSSKLASSVAYPFTFIKPCGVHGDVTLKDINQRIRSPPPKSRHDDDDSSAPYPTSALTGKPVVVKTKIRTEGGKGSITIMRTKG